MSELGAFVRHAEAMADAVRPVVLRYFADPVLFETKADASPVTAADREAEATMRRLIEAAWPTHGILGEEFGADRIDAALVWVLDPIDGTKSFVTGKPLFGTLIALLRDGRPIVGVIDMPALDERWVGAEGRVTTFNGRPVRVRACRELECAWLYSTSPRMFTGTDADAFERLTGALLCRRLRRRPLCLRTARARTGRPGLRGVAQALRLLRGGTGDRGRRRTDHRLAGRAARARLRRAGAGGGRRARPCRRARRARWLAGRMRATFPA